MSFNLFLTVSGVTGESVQRAHEGQIELSSWNLGVHNHAMAGPGGGGKAGKAQWDELIVTMPTTAALPSSWVCVPPANTSSRPCSRPKAWATRGLSGCASP